MGEKNIEKALEVKLHGNELFKKSDFEGAISLYTEAIALCPPGKSSDLSIMFQNRAAALERLDRLEEGLRDCGESLRLNNREGEYFAENWFLHLTCTVMYSTGVHGKEEYFAITGSVHLYSLVQVNREGNFTVMRKCSPPNRYGKSYDRRSKILKKMVDTLDSARLEERIRLLRQALEDVSVLAKLDGYSNQQLVIVDEVLKQLGETMSG